MDRMRKLTFKGFLTQYVKKLSYFNTLNLERLADEAITSNARLRAPLVLYALVAGKKDCLLSFLERVSDPTDMTRMLHDLSVGDFEDRLRKGAAPDDYLKVWNSFLVACEAPKRDNDLKGAMRRKVLQLQVEKNCSNYRIYTDLKLNPGNINSWLKNGDCSKVSYRTAERVMNYVMRL